MNYVGQLAGQVFVTVKELYRGLNPATLSGCIDVIVVRQPNGNLQCSPFHVRFGKMGVLRSGEKVVDIEINGEAVDLHMKLGDNGEAFFVTEQEENEEDIPSHLATSPILLEGAALMESQLRRNSKDWPRSMDSSGPSQPSSNMHLASSGAENPTNVSVKKRRKRRRKSKVDNLKREDNCDTTEDEDMFTIDMSSDEECEPVEMSKSMAPSSYSDMNPAQGSPFGKAEAHPHSDSEWSHLQSPPGSRPATPKSDSELVSKPVERGLSASEIPMHWAWGELPQATKAPLHKTKESSTVSINMKESTHFRIIPRATNVGASSSLELEENQTISLVLDDARLNPPSQLIGEPDIETLGAAAPPLPFEEEPCPGPPGSIPPASKTDSPSKKKDKRSRHLGADGVYLDDITCMDPEVAALYFPKSGDTTAPGKSSSENGARSANQSPQSVGSSGIDSGVESISDGLRDLPSISISLCGGLTDNKEITREHFIEQAVTYQQFVDNPAIIDDPNLVVKIGNKYYNWPTAAPLLLAVQAFQKPLPKCSCFDYLCAVVDSIRFCFSSLCGQQTVTIDTLMRDKMTKKGGRWWFSWKGRNTNIKSEAKPDQGNGPYNGGQPAGTSLENRIKDESSSSDEDPRGAKQSIGSLQSNQTRISSSGMTYKKTLRLTSDQLKSLKLKNGPNDVVFSVTTQYQGTSRCEGTIYLWNWDDKIIISDIDGTITRSDTLGHILPTLGKDWTHQGIARLYHKVSQNGYKFLYCSARAIGMADMTRGYLHWVNERGTVLPQGPVLLSPSSLFSALHREVIEKKPEKFKIECLTDIKTLFQPNEEPFYAAFGNRSTDVYSYKEVGVSLNRIFTVNPKGELIQEHAKTNISSYVRLCEVVDHIFPLLKRSNSSDFPCSDTYSHFTFWREPLPPVENQDIHPSAS
ncbi:phosphatidate phosphatase LPIN1 isoform X3 [Xenopus laevis]|uniref:phosphatidate phosphatase n=1 Tax=Xenopus laevis TaxID=8355 RepID=A0A8J1KW49_XENLA|nr:phosphatidate phosphatase LPIN1 isoform X3 [Xenopus laevis]